MRKSLPWLSLVLLLVLGAVPSVTRAEDKEKEEGAEQKIKFTDAPAAVQKTLTEEAKGAKIENVDKETDDGKTIYEADVMINGKNYEIKVAEDGTLIQKKLDDESKEKDKDEKDEKGEKGDKAEKK